MPKYHYFEVHLISNQLAVKNVDILISIESMTAPTFTFCVLKKGYTSIWMWTYEALTGVREHYFNTQNWEVNFHHSF